MAGRPVTYRGSLSRNVMRIYQLDVMTLGLVNPPDSDNYQILAHRAVRRPYYRKLVFREDVLVGAMLINGIEQGGLLLSLIQNKTPITVPKARLLAPEFNFGQLLA